MSCLDKHPQLFHRWSFIIFKKKNANTSIYICLLYIVLIAKTKYFLFRNWTLEICHDFMKLTFLGNKMAALNEHLRAFKCSAVGGNLLQEQEKKGFCIGFRGLGLWSASVNYLAWWSWAAHFTYRRLICLPLKRDNDTFLSPRTGFKWLPWDSGYKNSLCITKLCKQKLLFILRNQAIQKEL